MKTVELQSIGKFIKDEYRPNVQESVGPSEVIESSEYVIESVHVHPETVACVLPFIPLEIDGEEQLTSLVVLVPFHLIENNAITLVVLGKVADVYQAVFNS